MFSQRSLDWAMCTTNFQPSQKLLSPSPPLNPAEIYGINFLFPGTFIYLSIYSPSSCLCLLSLLMCLGRILWSPPVSPEIKGLAPTRMVINVSCFFQGFHIQVNASYQVFFCISQIGSSVGFAGLTVCCIGDLERQRKSNKHNISANVFFKLNVQIKL